MLENVIQFFSGKFPGKSIDENTLIFELVESSIDFLMMICSVEEELNVLFPLEEVDDITKVTVKNVSELLKREEDTNN